MSSRVLHTGQDLLSYTGNLEVAIDCSLPSGQTLVLNPASASDRESEQFMELLRIGRLDQWMTPHICSCGDIGADNKEPDAPAETIRLSLGQAFHNPDALLMSYVLVFQGASGGRRQKISISRNVQEAANAIIDEAKNGYSTVLCAGITATAASFVKESAVRGQTQLLEQVKFFRARVTPGQHRSYKATKRNTNLNTEVGELLIEFIN
ncbi:MAG: hypothetical protein Q9162_000602 [Coniocarpon cinnabarinum]